MNKRMDAFLEVFFLCRNCYTSQLELKDWIWGGYFGSVFHITGEGKQQLEPAGGATDLREKVKQTKALYSYGTWSCTGGHSGSSSPSWCGSRAALRTPRDCKLVPSQRCRSRECGICTNKDIPDLLFCFLNGPAWEILAGIQNKHRLGLTGHWSGFQLNAC